MVVTAFAAFIGCRGRKFAVVTAFVVFTCTRHCSWMSAVVTAFCSIYGVLLLKLCSGYSG